MEEFINPKDAAKQLGISLQTLWFWCKKDKIEHIKIGSRYRFTQSIINRILSPHNVKSKS